ncbi:hypothetical protein GLOIN_2v1768422 [Rhizophagus irregularis DAOM 181602=DAOM 197198]|uniref:Uncharacterized protein n=1 Tax=Rhizophagus irregularis (strain DAOM 181602 / DAOM 197198 / MUCL 43194) TaxID=747089 RepID=A0A2P4QH40_RHIID|nr:hypothetical protein GLOIN_2v1768422 [Rhizophagus irregularis DAOM 181602=DAOM 197198]POG76955.1 hypothetical protein GLOIN_2v1768422 [Rhizophagus irregularis DAOM 181602=DAOM 197198]GET58557.1 hypothetical protein GLOIN_2v1768422 [Rhizophagus irregularis DAOM 181602=DAOM 197198]|eukprot:XP_025183821.1 hypothetical protein GLOIN_2v1768422 [Rhizophagus irregularis DAOM 181602=DAOM 197198]
MNLDSRTYSKLHLASYGDENFEKYRRIVDRNVKVYENDKVYTHPTNYIYCSICDSLIFIPGGNYSTHLYHDNHLKRCISGNTILNEHARRNEILKYIDRKKFQIWQYKQYILQEKAKINHLRLEFFSQFTSHSEKDKLALISYDYDICSISYKAYAQAKVTIAENTMPNTPNFVFHLPDGK